RDRFTRLVTARNPTTPFVDGRCVPLFPLGDGALVRCWMFRVALPLRQTDGGRGPLSELPYITIEVAVSGDQFARLAALDTESRDRRYNSSVPDKAKGRESEGWPTGAGERQGVHAARVAMAILLHGTTRHRADKLLMRGPDPNFVEPGGGSRAENFSTCLEG